MKSIKRKLFIRNKDNEELASLRAVKNNFFKINWIKTIWFNFKALPFKQAIKIPIIIGYNVKIRKIGEIIINNKIYLGMISIGVIRINAWESSSDRSIFTNHGKIILNGRTKFHPGIKITVANNAILSIGERNSFGCKTKIIAYCAIVIGNDLRISWEGQIFDTDFHFLRKINANKTYIRSKPVIIGNNVFIGNSVTIGKGTKIPNGCVISCCSKVSGDYSEDGENLLISGNPSTVLTKGFEMGNSWFPEHENETAKLLNENQSNQKFQRDLGF